MSHTTKTERISVGNGEIAFDAPAGTGDGGGFVILFVHGTSFNRKIWTPILDTLAAGHRPIAFDNPGHGESSPPPVTTVDEGVAVLKGLHDALGLGQVVLIGHSMGGAISQQYFNTYPEDVLALGLVSTAPRFLLTTDTIDRWLADPATYRLEEMGRIVAPETSEDIRNQLFGMRDETTPAAQRADLIACTTWDNEPRAFDIDVPVLAITANHDRDYFRDSAARWGEKLSRAEVVTIEGAGHMMMVEKAAETAAAISRWVSSLSAPTVRPVSASD